nr:hypothetical protein [uncultured Neisseria sp.]
MKRPIPVTIATVLYFILTALTCFTTVALAIYSGDVLIEVAASAFPFLPWWLSMLLYFILLSLPVFIAVGLLSGNRSARWLAVVLAAASLIMVYDMASYSSQQIIIQSILHPVLLLLIFNPVSNRYFTNAASKTES